MSYLRITRGGRPRIIDELRARVPGRWTYEPGREGAVWQHESGREVCAYATRAFDGEDEDRTPTEFRWTDTRELIFTRDRR
jgi:hypothetical protein